MCCVFTLTSRMQWTSGRHVQRAHLGLFYTRKKHDPYIHRCCGMELGWLYFFNVHWLGIYLSIDCVMCTVIVVPRAYVEAVLYTSDIQILLTSYEQIDTHPRCTDLLPTSPGAPPRSIDLESPSYLASSLSRAGLALANNIPRPNNIK